MGNYPSLETLKNELMKRKVAIGIDIGGTSTKYGAVDEYGQIHFQGRISTGRYGDLATFVKVLSRAILREIEDGNVYMELVGVGVGAPHGVRSRGTIEHASNLPWKGVVPLADLLSEALEAEVTVTNDANAAAIGEMIFGGAKDMKDFVMITLGTGLGSAIVTNGHLVEGHDGFAGELGHVTYSHDNGRYCNCGRRGCLETYVSATGIKRTVYKLLADHFDESELRSISFDHLSTHKITECAKEGDAIALEAFRYTGKILGSKLAETIHHTNPEAIFLLGGLSQAGMFLFEPTKEHINRNVHPVFKDKVQVLPSQLEGSASAILGAAALVWHQDQALAYV
jgi:glucokinase